MNISLDFDDTYTRDPDMWNRFIELALNSGHNVYCITARADTKENKQEVYSTIGQLIGKDHCLFTDGLAKAKYAYASDIQIDVLIDDLPSGVDNNKKLFADFKNSSFPY